MSTTTLDAGLARRTEPRAPEPARRLAAVGALARRARARETRPRPRTYPGHQRGRLNASRLGRRTVGQGSYAAQIAALFAATFGHAALDHAAHPVLSRAAMRSPWPAGPWAGVTEPTPSES